MKMPKAKVLALKKVFFLFLLLLTVYFNPVSCIVGRDLVLTPRQGLQLNGKSIYYEEDSNEVTHNLTVHPWERTLKHVTFVTLFTNAAASAVAGNISKLKEYTDFLESPYLSKENVNPIRFGDIVTLANGRLEQTGNHSYRFIEGTCGYDCEPERVWALWQVQKIRHRDQNQKFRYEMKFSVSPLHSEEMSNENNNHSNEQVTAGSMYVRRNALKTYIQKEDDYPQSFGRIIYPEETAFAYRRQDDDYMGRNFRQTTANNDYRQVTPIPQPTFIRGIFQAPPPRLPPSPERLNIGEYMHDNYMHPKATPKIEIFPNLFNLMNRNNFPAPTTFRPNYQVKLIRPDIYQSPVQQIVKFPAATSGQFDLSNGKLSPPLVTHHFHHHFFMPQGSAEVNGGESESAENHIGSMEQQSQNPVATRFDKEVNAQVTPGYYGNYGNGGGYLDVPTTSRPQTEVPPAPQKISFPLTEVTEHIVEVTPPSPLKKPQVYHMYPINVSTKVPLLFYPTATNNAKSEKRTPLKPFVKSEQLATTFRYSEPDPLYANDAAGGSQLEAPYHQSGRFNNVRQTQPHDSIEAQLPSPDKDQNVSIPSYVDESLDTSSTERNDLELNHSQKLPTLATEKTTDTTVKTEAPEKIVSSSTSTVSAVTVSDVDLDVPQHVTTSASTTTETSGSIKNKSILQSTHFVSTSTTVSPLRAVSRGRSGRPTTTTPEPVVLKWKPKRRNQHSNVKFNSQQSDDNKAKGSIRHEEVVSPYAPVNDIRLSNSTAIHESPQKDDEIFEVLTQKSVSKSVSIKVGNNGEEIPILIDDNVVDNAVKTD